VRDVGRNHGSHGGEDLAQVTVIGARKQDVIDYRQQLTMVFELHGDVRAIEAVAAPLVQRIALQSRSVAPVATQRIVQRGDVVLSHKAVDRGHHLRMVGDHSLGERLDVSIL
jgi:hypothetical protein